MKTRQLRGTMTSVVVVLSATGLILTGILGVTIQGGNVLGVQAAHAETVFIPGTWNPGEVGSLNVGREQVVQYAAAPPILGDYPNSVREGAAKAADMVNAMPLGSTIVMGGFSQGGQSAREGVNQPGVATDYNVTVVTTGDPCTERTGILWRSPQAQAVAGIPCSLFPSNVHGVVISRADDPLANFPEKIDGITVANALAAYSYYHASGYGPVDLSRSDVRSVTVGNVTYVTIPADSTAALVRLARDHGFYVSPEVEKLINDDVAQSDPGPHGAPPPPMVQVSAPVTQASMPVADPLTQAVEAVQEAWQNTVVQPLAIQAENYANNASQAVTAPPSPLDMPSGNVEAASTAVKSVLPPQAAPVVDQWAAQVQNSPLGGLINGLPQLG
jgi:hypothetical protein